MQITAGNLFFTAYSRSPARALGFENACNYLKTLATSVGGFNFGDVGDMSARPSQYMSWFARYFDDEETMQYKVWGKNYYGQSWGYFDTYFGVFDINFDNNPYKTVLFSMPSNMTGFFGRHGMRLFTTMQIRNA